MTSSTPTPALERGFACLLLLSSSVLSGCPSDPPDDAGGRDAATDAGADAGSDSGLVDAGDGAIERPCTEGTSADAAPTFAGATSAVSDGPNTVVLRWDPASDDDTDADTIRYRVYVSTSGDFNFSMHRASARGGSEVRVTGLDEGVLYRFVVRAEDRGGQRECNEVVVEATPTPITGCVDYDTWIQPIFDERCLSCHGGAESNLRRGLRLESLAGLRAGGESGDVITACQPERSLLYLKVSAVQPVQGHRMPYLAPDLTDAQVTRIRLWIEQGATASCPEDPNVCADTTAPTFDGAESVTVVGSDLRVCWSAASDDVSDVSTLRYATYLGLAPGTEDYRWTSLVSAAAGTCTTLRGIAPGQEYCFVTRARDEAGNEDSNTVERCVTMPSVSCVDLGSTIQPLLVRECVHCHGGPAPIAGLALNTRAEIMAGSSSGPVVVACDASESLLAQKIADPPRWGLRMPADGPPHLGEMEIAAIRDWIDQGARGTCGDPAPCTPP